MELKVTNEALKELKRGRRVNLFKTPNQDTWLLYFPPGDVQRMHSSLGTGPMWIHDRLTLKS